MNTLWLLALQVSVDTATAQVPRMDLTSLTGPQAVLLTSVATLVAAFMAGAFAVIVATINAWNANRMASHNSERDYLLKLYQPYFDAMDNDALQLVECGVSLVMPNYPPALLHESLVQMRNKLQFDRLRPSEMVFTQRSQKLKTAAEPLTQALDSWITQFNNLLPYCSPERETSLTSTEFNLKKQELAATNTNLFRQFAVYRLAVERYIFFKK